MEEREKDRGVSEAAAGIAAQRREGGISEGRTTRGVER